MSEHTIRESRPTDYDPWSDGKGFTGKDWKKLDLAIDRFWGNTQLVYCGGAKIRTKIARKKPSRTLFDVLWNPEKRK